MQGNVGIHYKKYAWEEWIRLGIRNSQYEVIPRKESAGFTTLRLMGGIPGYLLPIGRKEI